MAEKINATCAICGKGYYKCLSCDSEVKATPWKQYTDTSEHYKIYQVIHGYTTGVYTKDEARERLQIIDLSDLNELRENIKDAICAIMNEDTTVSMVYEQPVVVETPVVELEPEPGVEHRPYIGRKKKYSMPEPVVAE